MAETLSQQSAVPATRAFQIDPGGLGGISESVNLFRGDVTLPLSLVSVTSRSGLEASASLLYVGPGPDDVDTWNLDAPTGPCGLGWRMGFDFIALDDRAGAAPTDRNYYLVADGSSRRLFRTSVAGDYEEYELEQYEFWRIRYYPAEERWVIVKEDGGRYTYGGPSADPAASPVQYGVKWGGPQGNWRGSSVQSTGQWRFPVGWNLAEITSPWGDLIRFDYENDLEVVGTSAGLTYTRASRLARVTAPFGRVLTYHYGEKVYDTAIREYQIPHVDPNAPRLHAFQDRYDTRYLAAIEVTNAPDAASGAGELVLGVRFDYDLVNIATGHEQDPDYYKRYLTGVVMTTAEGLALPNYAFSYFNEPAAGLQDGNDRRGALRSVIHPAGGTSSYEFSKTLLTGTSRSLDVVPGGVPRVWFGSDYTVVTVLDGARQGLGVTIYSWTGDWVAAAKTYTLPQKADIATLRVSAESEFFALSFKSEGTNPRLYTALFHKRYGRRGDWFMDDDLTVLTVDNGDQGLVATGTDFAVAVSSGGHARIRVWDPVAKAWIEHRPPDLPRDASYALAATGDYYALASYQRSGRRASLSAQALDHSSLSFRPITLQTSTLSGVEWNDSRTPQDFWSAGSDYVVATYATRVDDKSLDYRLLVQQWDGTRQAQVTLDRAYTAAASDDLSYLQTVASSAVIGNVDHLFRYNGVRWVEGKLPLPAPGAEPRRFAYGADVAVVSGPASAVLSAYDPSNDQWAVARSFTTGSAGIAPTISGDLVTVGRSVLRRNPGGGFTDIFTLPSAMLTQSMTNRAPLFLGYQDTSRTTIVLPVANGQVIAAGAIRLLSEQIVVAAGGAGTSLVGPAAFVTFTGQSFDQPAKLTLHHYLDRQVAGAVERWPVSSLLIDSGVASPWGGEATITGIQYAYDLANVSLSPDGTATEFAAATAVYGVTGGPASVGYPAAESTPYGRSEYRYHNDRSPREMGLVPDDALLGEAGVYYSYLNGMLYDQTDYDADGNPVGRVMNTYEVITATEPLGGDAAHPLVGAYIRPLTAETSQYERVIEAAAPDGPPDLGSGELAAAFAAHDVDVRAGRLVATAVPGRWRLYPDQERLTYLPVSVAGTRLTASVAVTRSVSYAYSRATGLLTADWTSSYDAHGRLATARREIYYGWQVPEYHALADEHVWSPVVVSARFHQLDDAPPGRPVELALTTLKEWAGTGEASTTLAPCRTYTALSAAAYDPQRAVPARFDDWANNAPAEPPEWRRVGEVTARAEHGAVLQAVDVQGYPSCNTLDATGTQRLAAFTNAALTEVSYLGFEEYETDDGWSLADGSSPREHAVTGDAHTGQRSLGLSSGSPSLRRSFALRDDGTVYVLSYWLKTPAGFSGKAAWRVVAGGATIATFPVAGSDGAWAYRHHPVRLDGTTGGVADVTVELTNADSAGPLLLDDILFAPLAATAQANVVDARYGDPVATVALSGATTRTFHDSFRRVAGSTGPLGTVTSAQALYLARQRNRALPFALGADAPNSVAELLAQTGGTLANLTKGAAWTDEWDGADLARWSAEGGRLVHTAAGEDTIGFAASKNLYDYAVRVSVHLPLTDEGRPKQPSAPLGVALGDALRAAWDPKEGWSVTVASTRTVIGKQAGDGVATDWLLLAPKDPVSGQTSVFFYADGERLFARLDAPPIAGQARLWTGDPGLAFSDIATLAGPQLAVTFIDGAAREVQRQAFAGTATVVAASVYDPIGRAALGTKETSLSGAPAYRPGFVRSFDPVSGVMAGEVSEAYPADQGFPYVRTVFSRTAQSLAVAQGMPGSEFAVRGSGGESDTALADNPHVRRIENGTNVAGFFGDPWPSHQYFVTLVTDPNGDKSYTITSKTGEEVGVARAAAEGGPLAVARFDYDGAGRLTRVVPPAGEGALGGGQDTAADWATVYEYNFSGEVLSATTPDSGTSRYVYDRAGALRFALSAEGTDPAGGADTITYSKYDPLGREVERGVFTARWDRELLAEKARATPGWPDATQPHTVTLRNHYDGDGTTPALFGQLAATETWRADGAPATEERFGYDLSGNVVTKSLTAHAFDTSSRVIRYRYDNLSNPIAVDYPEGSLSPTIVQGYDRLGRLHRLGTPEDPAGFGSYRYGSSGEIVAASTPVGPGRTLLSSATHNSPGWPRGARHEFDGGGLVLAQDLGYTEAGHEDAGYFDGKLASVATSAPGAEDSDRYQYDGLSRLVAASSTADPDSNLADASYDSNGNLVARTRGQAREEFAYHPGRNQLETITSGGQPVDALAYNRSGAVVRDERLGIDLITYDPVSGLPLAVDLKALPPKRTANERVTLSYDGGGQRAVKVHQNAAGDPLSARLYFRGAAALSMFELVRDAEGTHGVQYVYGPQGLSALLTGGKRYTVVRDHLGSPRRVVDETGAVVAGYDYTPFGATMTRAGSTAPDVCVYRFTGQEWDEETGLYNYRARLYDPFSGRFYDVDPAAKGSSPYVYVENNPTNLIDPDGQEPLTAFLILLLVSTVISAVAGAVTYAATHQGNFDVGTFFAYTIVGAVAGAAGAAVGFGAGLLATAGLVAAGVSTSTSIASGIFVGAVTGAVDGAVSGSVNQVGVNLVEGRPLGEGVGLAAGIGAGIGAALGGLGGGVTGRANRATARRLARDFDPETTPLVGTDKVASSPGMMSGAGQVNRNIGLGNDLPVFLAASPAQMARKLEDFSNPNAVLTIFGHGSRRGRTLDFEGFLMTADAIVDALQVSPSQMAGVNMLSCYAGSNGVARTVANRLNVPVRASNVIVTLEHLDAGVPRITLRQALRGGAFRTYYPSKLKTGWIALFGY
jgi:RHS repeat-associated protein